MTRQKTIGLLSAIAPENASTANPARKKKPEADVRLGPSGDEYSGLAKHTFEKVEE